MAASTDVVSELMELEEKRCNAIAEGDWATLGTLLAEDYHHTHMSGRSENKTDYIGHLQGHPRRTKRDKVSVRVFGNTAVMTGWQNNYKLDGTEMGGPGVSLQVWVKNPSGWQLEAAQVTRIQ
jgi:hypothetical protein